MQVTSRYSDDALAGAFAGFMGRITTAPFDVIKIRQQLTTTTGTTTKQTIAPPITPIFRQIIRDEGVLALWKGNLSATFLWVSYSAVQFGIYGSLKEVVESRLKHHGYDENDIVRRSIVVFGVSSISAIVSTVVTYPFDIMRTQFALQGKEKLHNSMYSYISYTLRSHGWKGLFSGIGPSVVGITPYIGLKFTFYEGMKKILRVDTKQSTNKVITVIKTGFIGGVAGGLSKLIVYPLDTLKKRLQAQTLQSSLQGFSVGNIQYKGMLDCSTSIYHTEGYRGYYKGIVPTMLKAVFSTAMTFMMFESGKLILSNFKTVWVIYLHLLGLN